MARPPAVSAPAARPSPGPHARTARRREDERLLAAYRDGGDRPERDRLVERFMPLAHKLARRYERRSEPLDDLVQVAALGLIKAIDRFDPERGTAFSSFAVPTILGELRRHFRDTGWTAHVPRETQERALRVDRAISALWADHGRAPTTTEIAEAIGAGVEQVVDAMLASRAADALSLDAQWKRGDDEDGTTLGDTLGEDDGAFDFIDHRMAVAVAMRSLPAIEREVVRLRFGSEMTQQQIGDRLGVSQMQVSRILRRALTHLRAAADAAGPAAPASAA
jgi:RNA polymerase sigma-B factor